MYIKNRLLLSVLVSALAMHLILPIQSNVVWADVYRDSASIPKPNAALSKIGADMPYVRYDSKEANIGGGAVITTSNNFDTSSIASQASEQSYVRLPKSGAYAQWKISEGGNGITMRFTMPDSTDGKGLTGSLDLYVNEKKVKTVQLTSYYMWQYFSNNALYDTPQGIGAFAFDEVHFTMTTSLKKGDIIKVISTGKNNLEYGVDFLEIEQIEAKVTKTSNALSVTDYGAIANDGKSDYTAISNCIKDANTKKKTVYFPEGTFEIDRMLKINASDIKITGAGMWYTNLQFTQSAKSGGGISGANAENIEFCNMYINSNLRSRYSEGAVYKCFMDVWTNCYFHDIWEEHFECGFWLADYSGSVEYCDGTIIENCRLRNNLADGVNFCQGTSNATVYNCSVRNNGDDGLAMWNNNYLDAKDESGNKFCYNTIEFVWRAGGIAIYGGNGHEIYNNYIVDTFMASGIHLNTVFDGYKFTGNSRITFTNNIIIRSGTSNDCYNAALAAIDISGDVKNLTFTNTYIYDAQHDGIRILNDTTGIVFNNLKVYGCGADKKTLAGNNNGALFRFYNQYSSQSIIVDNLEYANIPYSGIIFGTRNKCSITNEKNYGNTYTYVTPTGTTRKAESTVISEQKKPQVTNTSGKATDYTKAIKKIKKSKVKLTNISRAKNNKQIKIKYKKVSGAKGYQIKYSTSSKFKKGTKTIKTNTTSKKLKKLKAKKKYYIKVRAYAVIKGETVYGKWSKKKSVKVRKK